MHHLAHYIYTYRIQKPRTDVVNKMKKKNDVMRALTGYRIMHILGPQPGIWISTAEGLKNLTIR